MTSIKTTILIVALVCVGNFAQAQTQPEFFLPREHSSKDGETKVTLIFVELDGDFLTVITPKGKEVETNLKYFSRESQTWFKTAEKLRKQYVKRVDAFEKKIAYLNGSPSRRKVFYRALADYADISWMAEKDLLKLAGNRQEEIDERYKAICAFGSLSRITEDHYRLLYSVAANPKQLLHDTVESNPEPFIPLLARFGEESEDYLIHVACTGELVPPPSKKSEDKAKGEQPKAAKTKDDKKNRKSSKAKPEVDLVSRPVMLATTSGPKNRIRASAILGLGNLRGSKKVPNLMGTFLRLAQTKINGQKDLQSTKAVLVAVGNMGQATASVKNRFRSLEKSFPNEVKFAEEGLKAASERRKAQQQLDKLKRKIRPNRIFKDTNGKEIVFGRFLSYVDEFALFTNHKNEMIRIEKSSLSAADIKWIKANTKQSGDKSSVGNSEKDKG